MTKNNLSNCLLWLLGNPPSFGSVEHIVATTAAHNSNNDGPDANVEDMGRLQLAPQTAPRPRLLTLANGGVLTPEATRPTPDPKVTPSRPRPKNTGPRSGRSGRSVSPVKSILDDVVDIDDIDLSDLDSNLRFTSFGELGDPIKECDDDLVSRVGLVPKKQGKKRKSEEYEEELSLTRASGRTPKRVADSTPRSPRPDRKNQTDGDSGITRQGAVLAPEILRPPVAPKQDEDLFPRTDVDNVGRSWLDHKKSSFASFQSRPLSSREIRNTVPDSEDEVETENNKQDLHGSTIASAFSRTHRRVPCSSGSMSQHMPAHKNSSPMKAALCGFDPQRRDPKVYLTQTPCTQQQRPPKSSGSSTDRIGDLTADQNQAVDSFLEEGYQQCKVLLERLEKSKRNTDAQIAEDVCEGLTPSPDLVKAGKAIKLQIKATTQLIEQQSQLKQISERRQEMLIQRSELEDSGMECDWTDPENSLTAICTEIGRAKTEIVAKKVVIYDLLCQAGMTTQGALPSSSMTLPDSTSFEATGQRILVASTQKSPWKSPIVDRAIDLHDFSHLTTQAVNRTPLADVFQGRDDLQRHANSYQDSPIPSTAYRQMRQLSQQPKSSGKGLRSNHNSPAPLFDVQEPDKPNYSTRMGSPLREPVSDGFDDDLFDDDFDEDELRAYDEHHLMLPPARPALSPSRHERFALREVSHNPRRTPPQKQHQSMYASSSHIDLMQHSWSKDVASVLKKIFHLQGFRYNQLEAINETLSGKDAFILMPTGGGKSLCYQLPAVVQSGRTRGVTVVISPLISLMQDQVDHLKKLKIQAWFLRGDVCKEERQQILSALRGPHPERFIQILYVTPEMLSKSEAIVSAFQDLNKRKLFARLVVDEAHCVSQWGHDFRPDYTLIGEFRSKLRDVPVMALTATATENVRIDIMHNLGMEGAVVYKQSFNRPNLSYEVKPKGKGAEVLSNIAGLINNKHNGQAGIVYCLARKSCEKLAAQLAEDHGIQAYHYHAGMDSDERMNIQQRWQRGEFKVIVATIAFGMGIDKPDVRFVIHHTIPKSLEGYYQETGRAGRDGKRSYCYLFYGYGDVITLRRMIDDSKDVSQEQRERQKHLLRNVVGFCDNQSDCRRVQVLEYFNEQFDPQNCNAGCDNCTSTSTFETVDFKDHASNAVRIVRQIASKENPVTLLHCVDVYRGAKNRKISQLSHDQIDEFGLGSDLARGEVERLFYRLVTEDALKQYNKVNKSGFSTQYVLLGGKWREFAAGKRSLKIQVLVSSANAKGKGKAAVQNRRKKVTSTGVKAASEEYPASTNVSSPVQPYSRRSFVKRQVEDSSDDEFVIPDDVVSYEDDDVDADFEPVREHGVARKTKQTKLGPPITVDDRIADLNETHQHILKDFVEKARKALSAIVIDKQFRQKPVTDTMLREIGMSFPQNQQELIEITGMNADLYKHFGPVLLRLIKDAHNDYEALLRAQEDVADDNHKMVVEISDDEFGAGEDFRSVEDVDESESSRYFGGADDVNEFNARMSQYQAASASTSKAPPKKPVVRSRSSSQSFVGRGVRPGGPKAFTSKPRAKGTGGASKKKFSSSTRTSTGSAGVSGYVKKATKNSKSQRGSNGIGMMPT